jgi:hypothetical protein
MFTLLRVFAASDIPSGSAPLLVQAGKDLANAKRPY